MPNKNKIEFSDNVTDVVQKINPIEICEYVAEMSLELRNMCKQSGVPYLAYLLEIVFTEATDIGTRERIKAQSKDLEQSRNTLT